MADYFKIKDEQLTVLKDKVIVVTGCASGIGLATIKLLLSIGAKIVAGDLSLPPISNSNLTFRSTDVTSWTDLTGLFALAQSTHGRIDHVFVNAGIGPRADYLDLQVDASGHFIEPSDKTFDVDLRGVVNTSTLAFHYMKTQQPPGGSVVLTASASAFQRFSAVDYGSAKHGVLGFARGMHSVLKTAGLPIRINTITPGWTRSGLLPDGAAEAAGKQSQSADVPARSVAVLFADENRSGQTIYSSEGKFQEIDESILLPTAQREIIRHELDDDTVFQRISLASKAAGGPNPV